MAHLSASYVIYKVSVREELVSCYFSIINNELYTDVVRLTLYILGYFISLLYITKMNGIDDVFPSSVLDS